nr:MAG TPA_asm: hypothetical protein [Caudoviricetes sp.]
MNIYRFSNGKEKGQAILNLSIRFLLLFIRNMNHT